MGFIYEERGSDSPFIETVTRGRTAGSGSVIRPAEFHWHMVLVKSDAGTQLLVAGPLTSSGVVYFKEGMQLLWIKLKLGTYMPHLPARSMVNVETALPQAAGQSFWLKGSAWQFPDYDNTETFIQRLVREDVLARDPLIHDALQGRAQGLSPRTVRHHFSQVTGLTQASILQMQRAQRAADLLRQGTPILDTVFEAGYFDQPHLTRSLKQWIGHTPAQLLQMRSGA